MDYTTIRKKIREEIRATGATRIVYFHADHFEPWRIMPDRRELSAPNVDDIGDFIAATAKVEYARKLTLFMKSPLPVAMRRPGLVAVDGDELGFAVPAGEDLAHLTAGLSAITGQSKHELQVHLHHEFLTHNDHYATNPQFQTNAAIRGFLTERTTPQLDEKRFDLMVKLTLQLFRQAAGIPMNPWFFVHGMWALNASDPHVCHITREIEILLANGCAGDFTFPAGRSHTDPRYSVPVLVKPVNAPKGYDLPAADAQFAYGAGHQKGRFFIWSSQLRGDPCSIDYYSAAVRRLLGDPEQWLLNLIRASVMIDGTIYIKTHAHSMYPDYFRGVPQPIVPHLHPGVQVALGLLLDGASDAELEVEFLTAHEVYDRFLNANWSGPRVLEEGLYTGEGQQRMRRTPGEGPSVELLHANLAEVEQAAIAAARQRIGTLGLARSGATDEFAAQVKAERIFSEQDIELASALVPIVGSDHVLCVGCGCGALPMLLATAGLRVVGLDSAPARIEMARTMARAVARAGREQDLRFAAGDFNATGADLDPQQTVVLVPGIEGTTTDAALHGIALALTAYKMVVLDPDRFFRRRPATARRALAALLENAGFDTMEAFDNQATGRTLWKAVPSSSLAI